MCFARIRGAIPYPVVLGRKTDYEKIAEMKEGNTLPLSVRLIATHVFA